ncbi:MAG: SufD family Fe-S cluster assembly protein [Chryseolinea sp.]
MKYALPDWMHIRLFSSMASTHRTLSSLPSGSEVVVKPLADAIADADSIALEHLGKYVDPEVDGFVAWNTAAWTNGVFIHAKRNAIVDKPVYLVYWHNAESEEVVSVVRNLIVVETNAQLEVFERYGSTGSASHFSNHVTEALVQANGGLDLYTLQNDNGKRYPVRIHTDTPGAFEPRKYVCIYIRR